MIQQSRSSRFAKGSGKFLSCLIMLLLFSLVFQPAGMDVKAYAGFIADAVGPAQAAQAETGVPASVTIAQAILESNWGDSHIGSANNYFGIKCSKRSDGSLYYGNIATGCVLVDTKEWNGSAYVVVQANFRAYASMTDSFRDHGRFFIENPRYSTAMQHTDDPRQFAVEIARAGYATDPAYAKKLIGIMDGNDLYQYDKSPALPSAASTSTVLVFDNSTSMDDFDASQVTKMDAARDAGRRLLQVIGAENQAGPSASHEVAVVEFSEEAYVDLELTANIQQAQDAVNRIQTVGGTAMPKGLRVALDIFPSNPTGKSFIILLSDGLPNIGLNHEGDEGVVRQQVLDLSLEAGQRGICIYTVGLGDPGSLTIDEALLEQVAGNSKCGSYHNAENAWELTNVYINLRHVSTGSTLLAKAGTINQDQVLEIDDVQVPDNQAMILFTLNWPGSQLDAILRDPKGLEVDAKYPGASIVQTDTLVSIIIQNPAAGTWNVSARGVDVPGGVTTYNVVLSVRPDPNPPANAPVAVPQTVMSPGAGLPLAVATVVLAAVGVATYAMTVTVKRRRAGRSHPTSASLSGVNGLYAGRSVPITDGMLIGRSSSCTLRLDDPSISRRHARLRYADGRWYIQDLGSAGGTYLNGAAIKAGPVKDGDRLRVGSAEFELHT